MSVSAPLQAIPVTPKRSSLSFGGGLLQRKLTIGASNDPLEREADRIADQVLATPVQPAISNALPRIQRLSGQPTGQPDAAAPASVDKALASPGRPLEPVLRKDMEQRFGHDFSQVRVHSDASAEQSALDINATAYTVGHNMVFGAGEYAPGTQQGRRLIAHELTHVVHQSRGEGMDVGRSNSKCSLSPNYRFSPQTHEGQRLRAHELTHVVQQPGSCALHVGQGGGLSPIDCPSTLQRQRREITTKRIRQLDRLAHHPSNFGFGRNRWQRLTIAEQGAVMRAMDQIYGERFRVAFVNFAAAERLSGGVVMTRDSVGFGPLSGGDSGLWRKLLYRSLSSCPTMIYPNGTEFARCVPVPTAAQQVRSAVEEARSLQAAGNLQQAMTVLERVHPAVESMTRNAAVRAGLDPSVTDPEQVIDFLSKKMMMSIRVTLPPAVDDWNNVYGQVREGRTGPASEDEVLDDIALGW